MRIILQRLHTYDQGTIGCVLTTDNKKVCYMLELPDRKNKRGLSRIPKGTYNCDFMAKSYSGKYKNVWHVKNVKSRTGILIHSGNFAGDIKKCFKTHSLGCLLPALKFGKLAGQLAGLKSKKAMRNLINIIGKQRFILEVI